MRYREWDSNVLEMPVYELESIEEAPLATNYTYVKLFPYNIININKLESSGFRLCDISLEYFLDLSKVPAYETYGIRYATNLDSYRIIEIAENSFYLDRFHKDPNLTTTQATKLYQEWVINLCNGTRGNALFVADGFKDIVGFSSCILDEEAGIIDLTAVDFYNKDPNVSSNLIAEDINFFINNRCKFVRTSTQLENIPSRRSLERFGFVELGINATLSRGRNGS